MRNFLAPYKKEEGQAKHNLLFFRKKIQILFQNFLYINLYRVHNGKKQFVQ